ncbi:hypothetical protein CQ047_11250 [Microbacterium sp. MYb72]|uniref:hypothetical protein n=1 Tax=Microbacterium sp. MYb72 TaxID=1848693 RepID=UPI000CFB0982|nr:hypothetical protein [Microbacterium sp. MYb72]PRB09247.1 hypothetical protein CQ047_11250 [Microbacterium sp. MYb72]
MSDANAINFGLFVVTALATLVSVLAGVDARKSRTAAAEDAAKALEESTRTATAVEGLEAASTRAADAEKRLRRSELARDLIVWFERSTALMVLGSDAALHDREWVEAGHGLNARARVIDSEGAVELMQAAKRARAAVDAVAVERRIDVAMHTTAMLQLYAERWVDDGEVQRWPIEDWIRNEDERLRDDA